MSFKNLAVCALIEKDGLFLSVSRKDDHNDLGLPGGKIEPGESITDALHREVFEETGLQINVFDNKRPTNVYINSDSNFMVITIACTLITDVIKPAEGETGLVGFVTQEELEAGSFGEYNKVMFKFFNQIV